MHFTYDPPLLLFLIINSGRKHIVMLNYGIQTTYKICDFRRPWLNEVIQDSYILIFFKTFFKFKDVNTLLWYE